MRKPKHRKARAVPGCPSQLRELVSELMPAENLLLEHIAEEADVVATDERGGAFLLVHLTAAQLDVLAAYRAAAEDMEPDPDAEYDNRKGLPLSEFNPNYLLR